MLPPVDEQPARTSQPADQGLPSPGDHSGQQVGEETEPEQPGELAAPASVRPSPVQIPDRYDLRRCKLHVSITMLEDDGDPAGRRIILGVRNDEDDPITRMIRASAPEALLAALIDLQAQLEADLPHRQEAMRARLEQTKGADQQALKAAQKLKKPASQSSPSSSSPRTGQRANQEIAAPTAPATPAPGQKPATATRRAAKGQKEESTLEQMSLFGE